MKMPSLNDTKVLPKVITKTHKLILEQPNYHNHNSNKPNQVQLKYTTDLQ